MAQPNQQLTWSNDRVKLEAVREWIQTSVSNLTSVTGPIEIYRSNDWGITARFKVFYQQGEDDVVCKIGGRCRV